jgi:hypothetical protein
MLKKEIKNKNNSDKITFSTFITLNTQFLKKKFRNNLLNKCIQHFPFNNMKLDSFLEKKSMKHHFFLAQSATDLTRKETYCNISEFYK